METDTQEHLALELPENVRITQHSLNIEAPLETNQLQDLLAVLQRMSSGLPWWIGDVIVQFQTVHRNQAKDLWTGLEQAQELRLIEQRTTVIKEYLGYSDDRVAECVRIAKAFPASKRLSNLTWRHYADAFAETRLDADKAYEYLKIASDASLKVNEMVLRIRADLCPEMPGIVTSASTRSFRPILQAASAVKRVPVDEMSENDARAIKDSTEPLWAWLVGVRSLVDGNSRVLPE